MNTLSFIKNWLRENNFIVNMFSIGQRDYRISLRSSYRKDTKIDLLIDKNTLDIMIYMVETSSAKYGNIVFDLSKYELVNCIAKLNLHHCNSLDELKKVLQQYNAETSYYTQSIYDSGEIEETVL